jgi:hypothetical protein
LVEDLATATDISSHPGKVKIFIRMVRNVIVITWKTPEYLASRKEFFGIPGQSFLTPCRSEE